MTPSSAPMTADTLPRKKENIFIDNKFKKNELAFIFINKVSK